MPPKKTLAAKNLEALGVGRLAELLIEIGDTNAAAKRRLRLELAGAQSPAEVAREIRKRLKVIARARSFVDRQNRQGLVEDLQMQRRAIVDHVGKTDPKESLDLMWGFMALASSVFARCDDSSGTVIDIFREAVNDLGRLAEAAKGDATELADRAFQALLDNDYGQFDHLIPILGAALGDAGLEHLKQRFVALSKEPVKKLAEHERRKIGWSTGGPIYEDEVSNRHHVHVIDIALRDIADAQGDRAFGEHAPDRIRLFVVGTRERVPNSFLTRMVVGDAERRELIECQYFCNIKLEELRARCGQFEALAHDLRPNEKARCNLVNA